MPHVLENIITAVAPDPAAWSVKLTWANGEMTTHSFRHKIGKGIFKAFADPVFFAHVQIGDRGRSIEWLGEIDLCADALWFEVHPEDAPLQQPETA